MIPPARLGEKISPDAKSGRGGSVIHFPPCLKLSANSYEVDVYKNE
jgi:hypothetical protein